MENLTAVVRRIAAIEAAVGAADPDGFRAALTAATGGQALPAARGPVASSAAVATLSRPVGGRDQLTLGQMLGRVVPARPDALRSRTVALAAGVSGGGDSLIMLPVDAPVTSGFGPRIHPVTGQHRAHAGVDFGAPAGAPVRAASAGVVTFAGYRGGYGNLVVVDHGGGLSTRYAHQRDLSVRAGDTVAAGAVLGSVGSTGLSTGPHLHFEVRRDGVAVDPLPYLAGGTPVTSRSQR